MADTPQTPASGATSASAPRPRKPATNATSATTATNKSGANAASASRPASAPGKTGSSSSTSAPRAEARTRFNAAIDEAKAGVAALKSEALNKGSEYRRTAAAGTAGWVDEAKSATGTARQRAAELAQDGKARASDGLASLSKTVSGAADTIDEKLGKQYGDYARTAARTIQEAGAKLEAKDLNELGDDARKFVKDSPGAAVGIAAVAGFFLARLFRGSSSD